MPLLSSYADISYNMELLSDAVTQFKQLHTGAFTGYNHPRAMPDQYGLKALWGESMTWSHGTSAA